MNEMFETFFQGDFGSQPANWPAMVLGMLLAFAEGQVLAWVYMLTHSGLSYSRSFVNALLVLPDHSLTLAGTVSDDGRWVPWLAAYWSELLAGSLERHFAQTRGWTGWASV